MKPSLFFIVALAGVTLLSILGDELRIQWLHYGCKPLIMGLLFLYVQQHPAIAPTSLMRWLRIGMGFALAGDVFLMIQEADLFAAGLGAFLVMQVCYCVAFVKSIHQSGRKLNRQSIPFKGLPFLMYVISFLMALRPVFVHTPALSALWWPVVIYAICLGTMGMLSTQRQGLPFFGQVLTGALLFIFSDSVIALDKFLFSVAGAPWLIMITYAAAQYLIVTGMTRAAATPQESGLSAQ